MRDCWDILFEEVLVTEVCKKKNCSKNHTDDGRHRFKLKLTVNSGRE